MRLRILLVLFAKFLCDLPLNRWVDQVPPWKCDRMLLNQWLSSKTLVSISVTFVFVLRSYDRMAELADNKEKRRKCFRCVCSPIDDNVKLFRFPKPAVRNLFRYVPTYTFVTVGSWFYHFNIYELKLNCTNVLFYVQVWSMGEIYLPR